MRAVTAAAAVALVCLVGACNNTSGFNQDPSGGRYPTTCRAAKPGVCPDNRDFFP